MTMDIGFSVVESLKAVESWINNINSNMVGAAKTGYKANRISFGGGNVTQLNQMPGAGLLPVQYAEASMRVASTSIDFAQGQVVASSQNTHFALKDRPNTAGTNFFVVREELDTSGARGTTAANYRYYLTRDGEFHWVPANISYVKDATSGVTTDSHSVDMSSSSPDGYVLVNNYNLIVINRDGAPILSDVGAFANYAAGASTAAKTDQDNAEKPIAVNVTTPQNLVYSRYGSTIFDNNFGLVNVFALGAQTSFVIGMDVSQDVAAANQRVDRVQSALESSNSSVTTLIPELTLAQKMFTALSKVLTVFNENLDITFGLIR